MKPFDPPRTPGDGASVAYARALILATALVLAWICHYAAQQPPSFDGAMNLQVAYSLSEGEGYRRTYGDRPAFPREIQTNAPYTVPAAAVFKFLGVGKWQAQATNLLYLAALVLACMGVLRARFSLLAGALGGFTVLVTPGILDSGLHGYGEIPALFWAVLSALAFPWKQSSLPRTALAGVCLGLAVSTKTALLICFAAFGLCYVVALATDRGRSVPVRILHLGLLAASSLLPLALVELWKLVSLGGLDPYKAWWMVEYDAIGKQAGTTAGYQDTASRTEKFGVHLSLLSQMYGMPKALLAIWIALPPLFAIAWTTATKSWRKNGLLLCLVLSASIYFAWWLLVTPTQKAWHRRILDGSLLLNLAWIYIGALFVESAWRRWRPARARGAAIAAVALAMFALLAQANVDLRPKLVAGAKPQEGFDTAVRTLRELPGDAVVYAIGWSSAPALSLLSGRPFRDYNDTILRDIAPGTRAYLALDAPALSLKKQDAIISTYPSKALLPAGGSAQLYELDLAEPGLREEGPGLEAEFGDSVVTMDAPASMVRGFYRANRDGHRWMTARGLVGMTYDGDDTLSVIQFAPGLGKYMHGGGLSLSAKIDGCPLPDVPVERSGLRVLQFRIPDACRPDVGRKVVVELAAGNLLESSITRDERAMSVLVSALGFTSGCNDIPSCRKEMLGIARPAATAPPTPPPAVGPRASMLRAVPDHVDLCEHPDGLAEVAVDWVMPPAHAGKPWQVWVSAPNQPRTLWVSGTSPRGSETTGLWVRDRTTFELATADGETLDAITLPARPCSP